MTAVLSVGSGDGSVSVDLDGYGAFGSNHGVVQGGALIDIIGESGEAQMVYQSHLYIGAGESRQWLSDYTLGNSEVTVSEGDTKATSTFELDDLPSDLESLEGLNVTLVFGLGIECVVTVS